LFAAPPGERAVGVVQTEPQSLVKTTTPPPPTKLATPRPTAPVPKAKPKATPKAATPPAEPKPAEQPKTNEPAPTAGGGPTGGKGADVANIDTPGIDFPYPGYINNITRQILLRFQAHPTRPLTAEVRFVIRRDGSVDGIQLAVPSNNYPFDAAATGAVEAAANAKAFGPLPPGFREDILPVTFRFTPSLLR
jgi:protein TonB